jgi:uncharacterized repeat protein (TIGR03803 family)
MLIENSIARYALLTALMTLSAIAVPWNDAQASSINVIHKFCKPNCGIGVQPTEGLAMDGAGDLFGVASGGAQGQGVVYELVPQSGGKWKYNVLHYFCDEISCRDGASPAGNLVIDAAGNLYGIAQGGGKAQNDGVIFELSPNAGHANWTYRVVYKFCSASDGSCKDGYLPVGGLTYLGAESGMLYDGISSLYGVTQYGGKSFDGVVFSVTPTSHGAWQEQAIYSFCEKRKCRDGYQPSVRPAFGLDGNLYGATAGGGKGVGGVAYKLTRQAPAHKWQETVLYNFCSYANCADGSSVASPLVVDASGNLFGTTISGGSCTPILAGCGVLFEIAPDGTETTLYKFCSVANCADGNQPVNSGGLLLDASGELIGTTGFGGNENGGVLFRYSGGTYQVIYTFCSQTDCKDGASPYPGVITDGTGSYLGTTKFGGADQYSGTAFKFTP